MMKTKFFKNSLKYSLLASLTVLAAPSEVFAQSLDVDLIAYEASQRDSAGSADADIFEAMRALEEVGALIEPDAEQVNIDAILMAASTSGNSESQADALSALANVETKQSDSSTPKPKENTAKLAGVSDKVASNDKVVAQKTTATAETKSADSQQKPAKESDNSKNSAEVVAQNTASNAAKANSTQQQTAKVAEAVKTAETAKVAAPAKAAEPAKAPVKTETKAETKVAAQNSTTEAPAKQIGQNVAAKETQTASATTQKYDVVTAKTTVDTKATETKTTAQKSTTATKAEAQLQQVAAKNAQKSDSLAKKTNNQQETSKLAANTANSKQTQTASKSNTASQATKTAEQAKGASVAANNTNSAKNGASNSAKPAVSPSVISMQYVAAVYSVNNVDLSKISGGKMPTISELYQHAFKQKLVYQSSKPAVGDLAFFHNSYDRNQDGRWNDWHTQVGIVESIDSDSTISILVYQDDKIQRIRMNLKYPEIHKGKKGQILNTQLRANENGQQGLSSKLFGGFANLLGNAKQVTVIDNWQPGMKIGK